ncbi:putative membrane protein YdfK [Candidatus Thermoflexus japonica]|uniref:Putative membrane protein YdfK n=1 Tax=Candidatus Thermoflexus japonica TaxID=2035417 RepID=A0A2H5Y4R3_9CHLR|nr:putative membrane protein YdfK [Candidatus Thermoflexus japonica]
MVGTLINVATVVVGSGAGMLVGSRLPERVRQTVLHGLGLMTMVIGMSMALQTQNPLRMLAALLLGGVIGEGLGLEERLQDLGRWLETRISGNSREGSAFVKGFVTASLVFCVGPMTILGSIQDGLTGNYTLLAIKATLDGFASLAFSASLGIGVMFAALTVLIYQGSLTLGAGLVKALLTEAMITEMTAVGGAMILGIGLLLLDIKRVRVASFLPGLLIAPLLVALTPTIHTFLIQLGIPLTP